MTCSDCSRRPWQTCRCCRCGGKQVNRFGQHHFGSHLLQGQRAHMSRQSLWQLALFGNWHSSLPQPWLRTGNQNVLTFSRRGFIFWEGVHQPVMTHLNHVTVWAAGNWINLFWFTRIPGILTVLFLHCPCRSFNGRLGGRWQRQGSGHGVAWRSSRTASVRCFVGSERVYTLARQGQKTGTQGELGVLPGNFTEL